MKRIGNFYILLILVSICLSGCWKQPVTIYVSNISSEIIDVKYKDDTRTLGIGRSTTFEDMQLVTFDTGFGVTIYFRKSGEIDWKTKNSYGTHSVGFTITDHDLN